MSKYISMKSLPHHVYIISGQDLLQNDYRHVLVSSNLLRRNLLNVPVLGIEKGRQTFSNNKESTKSKSIVVIGHEENDDIRMCVSCRFLTPVFLKR